MSQFSLTTCLCGGQDSSLFQSEINQLDFYLTWSPSLGEGITWEY